jgi:hypothetical protein
MMLMLMVMVAAVARMSEQHKPFILSIREFDTAEMKWLQINGSRLIDQIDISVCV